MVKLPIEINKNNLTLRQIRRNDKKAIYSVSLPGSDKIVGYEVWKVIISKEQQCFGKTIPEREQPPSNECFGKKAWSFPTIELAEKNFYYGVQV